MGIVIHDVLQGSPEWLAAREGKFTGSNAYKLLRYGATDFARTCGQGSPKTYWTERGHILEEECIELYEQIRHCHVDRPGYVTNDQFPDCLFSPDGLSDAPLIECKAFAAEKHLSIYHGDVPFEVMAQIQFGLMICERQLAHLLIYNPDFAKEGKPQLAFKMIEIKANPNIHNNFKSILQKAANAQS